MIRVPWNKYETAILLEASLQVIRDKTKKKECIRQVSEVLRQMAVNQGLQIDDLYRNINGNAMQMTIMISVIEGKKSPLHSSPKIFKEVVDIYMSDKILFHQILNEAKIKASMTASNEYDKVIKGDKEMKDSAENKFYTWLSSKISASQVSDYFLIYQEIDNICLYKLMVGHLFDICDATLLNKIKNNIIGESNSNRSKIEKALMFYIKYIESCYNDIKSSQITQCDSTTDYEQKKDIRHKYIEYLRKTEKESTILSYIADIDKCSRIAYEYNYNKKSSLYLVENSTELKNILECLEANKSFNEYNNQKGNRPHNAIVCLILCLNESVIETKSKTNLVIPSATNKTTNLETTEESNKNSEAKANDYVVDFTNIGNLSYTRPTFFKIFGVNHTDVPNWTILYVMIVSLLCEKYPTIIKGLKSNSLSSGRSNFSDKYGARFMNAPKQVDYDLYVETNLSAMGICEKIRRLLNACNISYDDIEIHYAKKSSISSHSEINRYENVDFTQYHEILKTKFPRGFRLNDNLDIKKFRRYWNELYNEENNLSNEVIWNYIKHITIAHGKMSYLPEMMIDEETKAKLLNYIDETFANGKTAIYYEALYQMFRDELDNGRINNAEMLKTYLEYTTKDKYFLQKAYIAIDSKAKADPAEEVRSFLQSYEMPMATEDIIKGLPHLDKDKVIFALSGNNSYEFIRNQKGEYFHADIIEFTDSEITRIERWISDSISQNEYISGKELTSLIDKYLPEIHERYTFLTELGLRDTIAYKLRDKFSFRGKIISKYEEDLNMDKVFANFGKNHTPFSMEQLIALKDELGTTIYFDSLYRYAMRVSKNEFVSRDYADFDISATDDAIEQFCTGDFISLKDITLFGGFPSCGYAWNSYLLEYYVMYFSRKFKLLHTNFNMTSSVGAIVKKNTAIETFEDVIVRALAESNIALTTDDALNYLCESGLLARRSYSTIDNIVSRAKAYRAKKENKF